MKLNALVLPVQVIMVTLITLAVVIGMTRAEFQQPYYQNGFGLDSQLPLMPNHFEDHLLAATAAGRGDPMGMAMPQSPWEAAQQPPRHPPVVGDPYSSFLRRKEVLMPLINDLIRFHNLNTGVYEVWMNVDQQMDHRNGTRNETAGVVTSVVIESPSAFQTIGGGSSAIGSDHHHHGQSPQDLEQLLMLDTAPCT